MSISKEDRNNYGIVYTPNSLVDKILDLIPKEHYQNPELRWLDIGAGNGAFSLNLFQRLLNDLSSVIPNIETRKTHIIENMITMCEIYPPHIEKLKSLFHKANIITSDFLFLLTNLSKFDIIIGNPPYNINGQQKTPTNKSLKKSNDGKQAYVAFINKSLSMLNDNGILSLIVPTLWMKPDKAGLYDTLINNNFSIKKLSCLSTSESQKEFLYQAQTPTCFFYGQKGKRLSSIPIYDKIHQKYIDYFIRPNYPIPTHGINIINKLLYYVDQIGHLKVYKSNNEKKNSLTDKKNSILLEKNTIFENIKTVNLSKKTPFLITNYSNVKQAFSNQPKLVLAHKMYGFPYLDISGIYGISSRDNYIISSNDYSVKELQQIQAFLSTKTALFIFSTTNYRMRYLERYAFQFLPNITKIPNFPNLTNLDLLARDKALSNFFDFEEIEETVINNSFANYNFFL